MTMKKYTKDHDYVRLVNDEAFIGISDYAQKQLGDIVFVELPSVGDKVTKGDEVAVIESVKAASEVYSPIGGEIIAVNEGLDIDPALVNIDAEGEGWIFKLKPSNFEELEQLLDEEAYALEIK